MEGPERGSLARPAPLPQGLQVVQRKGEQGTDQSCPRWDEMIHVLWCLEAPPSSGAALISFLCLTWLVYFCVISKYTHMFCFDKYLVEMVSPPYSF